MKRRIKTYGSNFDLVSGVDGITKLEGGGLLGTLAAALKGELKRGTKGRKIT